MISTYQKWIPKLYIVSRGDLKAGAQACQGMHAIIEFGLEYPDIIKFWHDKSNHIVFLSAKDKNHLNKLIYNANYFNIKYKMFYEPDLNHEPTAIVFEPTLDSKELLKELPLALQINS